MKLVRQWTAHCETCNWSGTRCQEGEKPQQEKNDHLKNHSEHKVRVLVTGQ